MKYVDSNKSSITEWLQFVSEKMPAVYQLRNHFPPGKQCDIFLESLCLML
jgi:hypothetical protein